MPIWHPGSLILTDGQELTGQVNLLNPMTTQTVVFKDSAGNLTNYSASEIDYLQYVDAHTGQSHFLFSGMHPTLEKEHTVLLELEELGNDLSLISHRYLEEVIPVRAFRYRNQSSLDQPFALELEDERSQRNALLWVTPGEKRNQAFELVWAEEWFLQTAEGMLIPYTIDRSQAFSTNYTKYQFNSLMALMEPYQQELINYLEEHKLDTKNKQNLKQLIRYYNALHDAKETTISFQ
jgi:hypothetical protein